MLKTSILIILFLLPRSIVSYAQEGYLQRPELLRKVEECLRHTYNFEFSEAKRYQRSLDLQTPSHPAPLFLEALIVYWENFPLVPKTPEGERFISLMEESVKRAQTMIESESDYIEGVFFDLFGRAFQAMFWADNGKAARVIPDLPHMYRRTKEGFEMKEQFVEFYFSTGLYNYYIEAYPEAHPVYKPLVSFMQPGNKKLGLQQLNCAIQHSVFLRVESVLFMSLIQLNYENDLNTAALYARRLNDENPKNIFYQGLLVIILLHQHRYGEVQQILNLMGGQQDRYTQLIRTMAEAFMAEKQTGDDRGAGKGYQQTLKQAEALGPIADVFQAIAFRGLARLHELKGLHSAARRYDRKASDHTAYRFILEE